MSRHGRSSKLHGKPEKERFERRIELLERQVALLSDQLKRAQQERLSLLMENALLRQENARLRERVSRLEEFIRQHEWRAPLEKSACGSSSNISSFKKAPAWVKASLSLHREQPKKLPGAKLGHAPQLRKRPSDSEITLEVYLVPERCKHCQSELHVAPSQWHTHVQIDLPAQPQVAEVTRYWVGWSYCKSCKKRTSASGGKQPFCLYGPRLHAEISYWKFTLGLTLEKIQTLLKERHHLELDTGEISEVLSRTSESLEPQYELLRKELSSQSELYADETGWRNDGDNCHLWSFSNEQLSYYRIERSRGKKVVKQALGERFSGVLTSDCYGAYNAIEAKKQKCWAHFFRDIHRLEEEFPGNPQVGQAKRELKSFFDTAKHLKERKLAGGTIEIGLKSLCRKTETWLKRESDDEGVPWIHSLNKLRKRMLKHKSALYTFVSSGTDPTNNPAEREIRPAVLMRKTSYGNRSDRGAKVQAIAMSLQRTCKKLGVSYPEWTQAILKQSPQNPISTPAS